MSVYNQTASTYVINELEPGSATDLTQEGVASPVTTIERLQALYESRSAEIQAAVNDRVFAEHLSKYQEKLAAISARFDPRLFFAQVKEFCDQVAKTIVDLNAIKTLVDRQAIDLSIFSGQYAPVSQTEWLSPSVDRLCRRVDAAIEYYTFLGQPANSGEVLDYPAAIKREINQLTMPPNSLIEPVIGRLESFSGERMLAFAQYLKSFPVDEMRSSSDLPHKWRAILETAQAQEAAPFVERFRASDEARILRGLRRFFELPAEERQTDKQLSKTVLQLRSSRQEEIQAHLDSIAETIGIDGDHIREFFIMIYPPPEPVAEESVVESEAAVEGVAASTEEPIASEIDPEEEAGLKKLYLEELGIHDPEVVSRVSAALSVASLAHFVDSVEDIPRHVREAIFRAYPEIIYDYETHNIASYMVLLRDVLSISRGLELYRIFDPEQYPEHFSSEEVLERTARTARLLKETIQGVLSGEKKAQADVTLDVEAETIKQLNQVGLNGELLVGIVYAFIRGGTIYAGANALSARSISRSLTGNVRNLGGKELDDACQYLVQEEVLTVPKNQARRVSSWALQISPSKVRNPVLHTFLSWALPARHGGD